MAIATNRIELGPSMYGEAHIRKSVIALGSPGGPGDKSPNKSNLMFPEPPERYGGEVIKITKPTKPNLEDSQIITRVNKGNINFRLNESAEEIAKKENKAYFPEIKPLVKRRGEEKKQPSSREFYLQNKSVRMKAVLENSRLSKSENTLEIMENLFSDALKSKELFTEKGKGGKQGLREILEKRYERGQTALDPKSVFAYLRNGEGKSPFLFYNNTVVAYGNIYEIVIGLENNREAVAYMAINSLKQAQDLIPSRRDPRDYYREPEEYRQRLLAEENNEKSPYELPKRNRRWFSTTDSMTSAGYTRDELTKLREKLMNQETMENYSPRIIVINKSASSRRGSDIF